MILTYAYSVIDFCLPVWGSININKLNELQKIVNKMVQNYRGCEGLLEVEILKEFDLLSLFERYKYNMLVHIFKTLKYKSDVNIINETHIMRNHTRESISTGSLTLTKHNSETFKRSIEYSASIIWNALPADLKKIEEIGCQSFKDKIRQWLNSVRK